MTSKIILKCPKCGRIQEVELKNFNRWIRFQGHPYTCYCHWDEEEKPTFDTHVNMEVFDVVRKIE